MVRGLSGWCTCLSFQEKLQQTDVAGDSSMEEAWTTYSSLLQLSTLLEQQAKYTHTHFLGLSVIYYTYWESTIHVPTEHEHGFL